MEEGRRNGEEEEDERAVESEKPLLFRGFAISSFTLGRVWQYAFIKNKIKIKL